MTLQAGRSVLINANITTDNGNLTIVANELLANGVVNAQRDPGSAVLTMGFGAVDQRGHGHGAVLTIASGAGKTNLASGDITLRNITAGTITRRESGHDRGQRRHHRVGHVGRERRGHAAWSLASQGGNFINNAGAGALSTPGGRWLVYSQNPGAQHERRACGHAVLQHGLQSREPDGRVGDRQQVRLLAGREPDGDAEQCVARLRRRRTQRSPTRSPGSWAAIRWRRRCRARRPSRRSPTRLSSVAGGPYAITATLGTLASQYNYGFTFAPGQLSITPALLSYLADPKSRSTAIRTVC